MKTNEVLRKAEQKLREIVNKKSFPLAMESDEAFDFLINLKIEKAETYTESFEVYNGSYDDTMDLTSWELVVSYQNMNYTLGMYEYFSPGEGFFTTDILIDGSWLNAEEVNGKTFFEEFGFENESLIQSILTIDFEFQHEVQLIRWKQKEVEKKSKFNKWIEKYDGATIRVEERTSNDGNSRLLDIVLPDGRRISTSTTNEWFLHKE